MIRATFLALALSACATAAPAPESAFFARLSTLCGQSFAGRVVSTDAVDAAIASETLVMNVRDCSAGEIRIRSMSATTDRARG